ncbi:ABC transporter permease [Clostridium swellfunianum]|uniref:ABC transporter permease n=1 Tax=Clostridium swellfunianum TaxID=1367462 RepID=UPI00202E1A99|nr:ABC transporter permease [Clostridium swellfunianum]MCM0646885.1 ABC transporter permease [Clostridium swellfunianum]
MELIIGVLEQGLIFSIVAIGVYITYRILDFPDLSVDGSFPLGAAVAATCLAKNSNAIVACILAFAAGCSAGFFTGIIHVKLKITNLLCGILVMIGLYSINLRVMGKSNLPLFGKDTIFSGGFSPLVVIALFALVVKIALDLFLRTKLGFILIATGSNEQLVTMLSVNKDAVKVLGLMLSNGLVALSGAMMAQYQGFSDVTMGTGIVVMGLAAVIIGESMFKNMSFIKPTTLAIIGSIAYKGAIALALKFGLEPTDLKLITAIIVIAAISLSSNNLGFKRKKKPIPGGEQIAQNTEFIQSI